MTLRLLTWNLFHGRDHPPDEKLMTWRSRIFRVTERGERFAQVNRPLEREFTQVLERLEWDVALLQEAPPRWHRRLTGELGANGAIALTSRNSLAPLRRLAAALNPDLIASNEGGSNLTLVRGEIHERRELELRSGPRPERRMMAFTRATPRGARSELCIANLHASSGRANQALAEDEVLFAAVRATQWAGDLPLIFGGDLNLRPRDTVIFRELERRHGLIGTTGPASLDHLLVRGLEIAEPAAAWASERREAREDNLAIRLSDHAPVEATFEFGDADASDAPE